jgi:NTP pyrophosphatase (non-canonical NTP hydrolase)
MNPNQYQRLSMRTQCSQLDASERISNLNKEHPGLLHATQGLTGEVGELSTALEKHLFYGQDLDKDNVFEELGDCLWYIAEACESLGFELKGVMRANIQKLRERYPEKFEEVLAEEKNRDRKKELDKISQVRAEDDGVLYEKDVYTEMEQARQEQIPKNEEDKLKKKARNKAKKKHLCRHCGNPISDEVVRQLYLPVKFGGKESAFCPMCKEAITVKLLQVLER